MGSDSGSETWMKLFLLLAVTLASGPPGRLVFRLLGHSSAAMLDLYFTISEYCGRLSSPSGSLGDNKMIDLMEIFIE